jgi:hypothetical protein
MHKHCVKSLLCAVFIATLPAAACYALALIVPSQDDYELSAELDIEETDCYGSWGHRVRLAGGAGGVYCVTAAAFSDPDDPISWFNEHVPMATSWGWRTKMLMNATEPVDLCWQIDGAVQITGRFVADNGLIAPLGDCYAYGWAKEILSGLANKEAETKGSFSAEESNSNIGVEVGSLKVSLPIPFSSDEGDLNGDDICSAYGTKVDAYNSDCISLTGKVTTEARSHDGAYQALITVRTQLAKFELAIVD